ncbi:MAG: recombinase family protein, partial [Azospirillaceae bacterium]
DFARIVEVFDAHGVSFVSVTQAFNTTTSMGRLTLNMLLSFAQFEREVTGERIRDKIAASKRKGMWMGGTVPLGYEPDGRTLAINQAEAETVRTIFRLYLEHGTVRRVKEETDRLGLLTKRRRYPDGRTSGGRPMSRGYLYKLLGNPLYIGRIPHKGTSYEGQHRPIIDQETWDAVQAGLKGNSHDRSSAPRLTEPSPLIGKLFDADGHPLTPSHAIKNGRRYRYYVSRHLITGEGPREATGDRMGWRLPAREIERALRESIERLLGDRGRLLDLFGEAGVPIERSSDLVTSIDAAKGFNFALIERVDLDESRISMRISLSPILSTAVPSLQIEIPISIRKRGVESKLVLDGPGTTLSAKPDPALINAVARAHLWFEDLLSGEFETLGDIAERYGVSSRYLSNLLPLAFLAPDIATAILEGRQPIDLTAERLSKHIEIPASWDRQTRALGFSR